MLWETRIKNMSDTSDDMEAWAGLIPDDDSDDEFWSNGTQMFKARPQSAKVEVGATFEEWVKTGVGLACLRSCGGDARIAYQAGRVSHQFNAGCGMSLRQWYAGKAMQGLLAGDSIHGFWNKHNDGSEGMYLNVEAVSKAAWAMADAMLIQRKES
jgi:hypothetical protein